MRRSVSAVISLLLAAGLLVGASPGATAATCEVSNSRTAAVRHSLQAAVDASTDRDTLQIRGTCVGNTTIHGMSLRLVGIPTETQPTPTLDGGEIDRVLELEEARFTIRDLLITDGAALAGSGDGGGIFLRDRIGGVEARLVLRGSTSVSGNIAEDGGGGIFTAGGTIDLGGHASVTSNRAGEWGGGGIKAVYTDAPDLPEIVLNDSASVSENVGALGGGIHIHMGILTVHDSASVSGNAGALGGGIWVAGAMERSRVSLDDHATVTDNTARFGAGLWVAEPSAVTVSGAATVSGNSARRKGGGMYVSGRTTIRLRDSASVVDNFAFEGGGLYPASPEGRVFVCSDLVTISPNDPNDPPPILPCT